jgi:hypothetical protein
MIKVLWFFFSAFDEIDDVLKLFGAELFFFDKEVDEFFVGIGKIIPDEPIHELLFVFVLRDERLIQVGVTDKTAGEIAFLFQVFDGGGQGRIRRTRRWHVLEEKLDVSFAGLPNRLHGFLFLSA